MKGEQLNYDDIRHLKHDTKIWVEEKYHKSNLYKIRNHCFGITIILNDTDDMWITRRIEDKELQIQLKQNLLKIYEWISYDDYIKNKLQSLKSLIDLSISINDKPRFLELTEEYNNLIKENHINI